MAAQSQLQNQTNISNGMNRMGVASNGMQIPGGPDARAQFLMGMNMNMGMPQQMFVPQQQGPLPQHSQQHLLVQPQQLPGQTPHQQAQQAHNRIQEQAQTQMNNLRQQAVSVHQHTPKQQGQLPQQQGPHQSGPAAAAVAAVAAAAAAAASQPQSQDELNGNGAKGKQTRPIRPNSRPQQWFTAAIQTSENGQWWHVANGLHRSNAKTEPERS